VCLVHIDVVSLQALQAPLTVPYDALPSDVGPSCNLGSQYNLKWYATACCVSLLVTTITVSATTTVRLLVISIKTAAGMSSNHSVSSEGWKGGKAVRNNVSG